MQRRWCNINSNFPSVTAGCFTIYMQSSSTLTITVCFSPADLLTWQLRTAGVDAESKCGLSENTNNKAAVHSRLCLQPVLTYFFLRIIVIIIYFHRVSFLLRSWRIWQQVAQIRCSENHNTSEIIEFAGMIFDLETLTLYSGCVSNLNTFLNVDRNVFKYQQVLYGLLSLWSIIYF